MAPAAGRVGARGAGRPFLPPCRRCGLGLGAAAGPRRGSGGEAGPRPAGRATALPGAGRARARACTPRRRGPAGPGRGAGGKVAAAGGSGSPAGGGGNALRAWAERIGEADWAAALWPMAGAFAGIGLVGLLDVHLRSLSARLGPTAVPFFVSSFGTLSVVLYAAPDSKIVSLWNIIVGAYVRPPRREERRTDDDGSRQATSSGRPAPSPPSPSSGRASWPAQPACPRPSA